MLYFKTKLFENIYSKCEHSACALLFCAYNLLRMHGAGVILLTKTKLPETKI